MSTGIWNELQLIEDARNVKGPITLPDYVRWSHFLLIKELRRQYWRAKYPVPSE
ncbi:hypothetical protein PENSUB_12551 [Penicillium subrubescens]|uniref:Uncharacterized protein n=1 Tax=Penicillium subrubescens TaxID=1316194 RepID=A0A1Q5SYJ1_9EURO|nr:hypothetical protein PENSUB_12551 [Penicillium subrubescens]